jgi:hypothetical protein
MILPGISTFKDRIQKQRIKSMGYNIFLYGKEIGWRMFP